MKDDAQQALEELEQELLGSEDEDVSLDELLHKADELTGHALTEKDPLEDEELRALLADEPQETQEPAFDDPDAITDLDETQSYRNFSNGYGQEESENPEQSDEPEPGTSRSDKIDIGLMFASSVLALGIIGILIYWLNTYLKPF